MKGEEKGREVEGDLSVVPLETEQLTCVVARM